MASMRSSWFVTATPKAERKHAADYVTDCLAAAARAPSSRPGRSFA